MAPSVRWTVVGYRFGAVGSGLQLLLLLRIRSMSGCAGGWSWHYETLTRFLGRNAFSAFVVGFAFIGVLRVLVVFILAHANRGSLGDETCP